MLGKELTTGLCWLHVGFSSILKVALPQFSPLPLYQNYTSACSQVPLVQSLSIIGVVCCDIFKLILNIYFSQIVCEALHLGYY